MSLRQEEQEIVNCSKAQWLQLDAYREEGEVVGRSDAIIGGCCDDVVVKAEVSARRLLLQVNVNMPSNASSTERGS
jgi:hypothetical protein